MVSIKSVLKQIKSRPLITISLMFSLTITLIVVSSLYTSIIYNQEIFKIQNNDYLPNQAINYIVNSKDDINKVIPDKTLFTEIAKEADIKIEFTQSFKKCINKVQIFYSPKRVSRVISYDSKIIEKAKNNYAYLGNDIRNEFKDYVPIDETEYPIDKVIGIEGQMTIFDDLITIYTDDLNKVLNIINKDNMQAGMFITLYNKENRNDLGALFVKTFSEDYFDIKDITGTYNQYSSNNVSSQIIILIFVGLLSIITISTFWIIDRGKEIAIKRAFGAQNKHIILEIYKELLILCIFCGCLGLLISELAYKIINTLNVMQLAGSLYNIVICFIGIVIISIISSAFPIYKALRQNIILGIGR